MEFSFPEDSKSSSEETDRLSEQNYDSITGRSYECVFCKRGFTTAQALGGHMNIHRKDRASKTKPKFPPSSSSKVDDNGVDLGFYSAIRSSPDPGNYYSTNSSDQVNSSFHQTLFPSMRPSYGEVCCLQKSRDLFGEDWSRSLSLDSNPLCARENKGKVAADTGEEDGLDLELRLGYYP